MRNSLPHLLTKAEWPPLMLVLMILTSWTLVFMGRDSPESVNITMVSWWNVLTDFFATLCGKLALRKPLYYISSECTLITIPFFSTQTLFSFPLVASLSVWRPCGSMIYPSFPTLVYESWHRFPDNISDALMDFTHRVTDWNRNTFGNIFHCKRKLLARISSIQKFLANKSYRVLERLEVELLH